LSARHRLTRGRSRNDDATAGHHCHRVRHRDDGEASDRHATTRPAPAGLSSICPTAPIPRLDIFPRAAACANKLARAAECLICSLNAGRGGGFGRQNAVFAAFRAQKCLVKTRLPQRSDRRWRSCRPRRFRPIGRPDRLAVKHLRPHRLCRRCRSTYQTTNPQGLVQRHRLGKVWARESGTRSIWW